jgi:hypothetical protein
LIVFMKEREHQEPMDQQKMGPVRPPARPSLWRRLFRWVGNYKWPIIALLWLVAIALGYIGHSQYFAEIGETHSVAERFYRSIQLFSLETTVSGTAGWELQVARFMAPILAVYTGIQALASIFREQLQLFRLRFMKNHVIICGLGRKGWLLSREFREKAERVVVIEQDGSNGLLGLCKENGATVLVGNAEDRELLRKVRVHRAKYIISVCGNDGVNAEVAVHARELTRDRKGRALSCLVHITDLRLSRLLRERELGLGRNTFRLEFFNVFESGARVLLAEYPPFSVTEAARSPRPHLVVVGVGRLGESVVVNAARNWRDSGGPDGKRLRITLVDKEAERKRKSLYIQYPQMEMTCDLTAEQTDMESTDFEKAAFLFDNHGNSDVSIVYVCLDDDSHALSAGLTLQQRTRTLHIPIIVRMTRDAGLAKLLRVDKDEPQEFTDLHSFGLLDRTCTLDLILGCTYEIMARIIHEDYVRKEKEKGFTTETNPSLVPWKELPENLKESNRNQAEHIRFKLEAIGYGVTITNDWDTQPVEFSPSEVELMARMEHERFVEERLRQGWRRGTSKNLSKKTSPTLVPWNELPEEEKEKDRNAVRGISKLLAAARFQVYKL